MADLIYPGTDNLLKISNVKNEDTGAYMNSATVQLTIRNSKNGREVSGQAWPMSMAYVAASNGQYKVVVPSTVNLIPGVEYYAEVSVVSGDNDRKFRKDLIAQHPAT